jgi:molybdenum cofactor biosynthesis protein B
LSETVREHRSRSPAEVRVAVLTVTDTRSRKQDTGGALVLDLLGSAGHTVVDYQIVRDEPDLIIRQVSDWIGRADIDAVITTGGTGIAKRDRTFEAVSSLLERTLEGFGEIFRMLSFGEIGAAAMLSRAVAGTADSTAIFALPGSRNAIRLALERIILPEIGHVVFELRK